ncbi:MAG: hypothetical protein K2Y32_14350 [Candidatus Obscuribacterales bacterium]|nr:hypothetical protein [Candidatus Obscuribacterales bacterium]
MSTPNQATKAAPAASTKSCNCSDCGSALKSGLKYENICTTCQPQFNSRCGGCQRLLWDCMCIRPHTWE